MMLPCIMFLVFVPFQRIAMFLPWRSTWLRRRYFTLRSWCCIFSANCGNSCTSSPVDPKVNTGVYTQYFLSRSRLVLLDLKRNIENNTYLPSTIKSHKGRTTVFYVRTREIVMLTSFSEIPPCWIVHPTDSDKIRGRRTVNMPPYPSNPISSSLHRIASTFVDVAFIIITLHSTYSGRWFSAATDLMSLDAGSSKSKC